LFEIAACEAETIDQDTMRKGIHRSAPSFLETRPLGSSAVRKEARKIYVIISMEFPTQYAMCFQVAYSLAIVEVVRIHAKLRQHVVRNGTVDVLAVQVESTEHEPCPEHDAPIDLVDMC
jgi:hypothetical protein